MSTTQPRMKILAMCQAGICRSGAVKAVLGFNLGHEVLTIGHATASPETVALLCGWADRIIVMQDHMVNYIPTEHADKLEVWDVGADVWFNPLDRALIDRIHGFVVERGYRRATPPEGILA